MDQANLSLLPGVQECAGILVGEISRLSRLVDRVEVIGEALGVMARGGVVAAPASDDHSERYTVVLLHLTRIVNVRHWGVIKANREWRDTVNRGAVVSVVREALASKVHAGRLWDDALREVAGFYEDLWWRGYTIEIGGRVSKSPTPANHPAPVNSPVKTHDL